MLSCDNGRKRESCSCKEFLDRKGGSKRGGLWPGNRMCLTFGDVYWGRKSAQKASQNWRLA